MRKTSARPAKPNTRWDERRVTPSEARARDRTAAVQRAAAGRVSNGAPHDELRALVGAYAIGALEPGERADLEQHLAGCQSCRDELAQHLKGLDALTPSVPVPSAVWARIENEIGADRHAPDGSTPRADPSERRPSARSAQLVNLRRRLSVRGLALAVALIAIAIAVPVVASNGGNSADAALEAQIEPTQSESVVSGSVELLEPDTPSARIVMELSDLPAAPSGHHYQVWVLRSEGGGAMEAIGAFSPDSRTTRLELPLPGPGHYSAVDISIQEDGGPPAHSGVSIAGAVLS